MGGRRKKRGPSYWTKLPWTAPVQPGTLRPVILVGRRRFFSLVLPGPLTSADDDDDFHLCLQKQQPTHRYIPIGYVPPGITESTSDDATIMSLVVLCKPFTPLVDVVVR
jgi:hypothetical protein